MGSRGQQDWVWETGFCPDIQRCPAGLPLPPHSYSPGEFGAGEGNNGGHWIQGKALRLGQREDRQGVVVDAGSDPQTQC